ncbi:predicted protein [Coccidioides posadasii str. Silveira]|uniref:Predicted protein n=1 Tax=Coccidioides posadasii (strain RMSCC 757 / Silveira) TaxID=443226 RepID=E9D539_COCPS|nr:predicted protein [Coccidioides posadasii str. Silveira]
MASGHNKRRVDPDRQRGERPLRSQWKYIQKHGVDKSAHESDGSEQTEIALSRWLRNRSPSIRTRSSGELGGNMS